ncbi:MAG: translocation/assembly module TamB domain-containing protein [Candidatus Aminicenantales bacterium]
MNVFKKFRGLIVFSLVMAFLFGALVVGKNIFLRQAEKKIEASFRYARLRLSYLPPSIVLEDVRGLAPSPFFSASRITIRISYLSLLRKEKPLTILIEGPVLRMEEAEGRQSGKAGAFQPLPFAIEKGLVRDGEIVYRTKQGEFRASGVRALFTQSGDVFSFQADAVESLFSPASGRTPFGGAASLAVSGKGREIAIHRAVIEGNGFVVKAEGKLVNPSHPILELETIFNVETAYIAPLLDIPYDWDGRMEGRGKLDNRSGAFLFDGEIQGRGILLNGMPLGETTGRISLTGPERGEVDLDFRKKNLSPESLSIRFDHGRVEGQARGVRLDPIMKYEKVPWPVRSPVWGDFVLENMKFTSEGEFRDSLDQAATPPYAFSGKVRFDIDLKTKDLVFSSDDLDSSFCRARVRGSARVEQTVDMEIDGEIKDVAQARAFTALILAVPLDFPEIRGRGTAGIKIAGDYVTPRVTIDFSCRPGGFDRFDAASVEGSLDITGKSVLGRFRVDDPDMKGDIDLAVEGVRAEAEFRMSRGTVEKILPRLDIPLPLQGTAGGTFQLVQVGTSIDLRGDFTSSRLILVGQPIENVRSRLEWKDGDLRLSSLGFTVFGGSVGGRFGLKEPGLEFDMDLAGKDFDLGTMRPGLGGTLQLDLKGKGVFGKDRPKGSFEVRDIRLEPFQKMAAAGEWSIDYLENRIDIDMQGGFLPGQNGLHGSFRLPLNEDSISGDIKGDFNNLDLLLPWKGAKGRLNYLAEIRGSRTAPRITGVVDVQGSLLPLPQFAHALNDYSGLAFIQDGKITLRSFQGKLGGGDILASGEIGIGAAGGVDSINIKLDGSNMLLSPFERTRALTDGSLRLIKDSRTFILDGELVISRLSWRREILEKFGFSTPAQHQVKKEKGFFDDLALNLRLRADENAWMENSLGRISGRFDLNITGNVNSPAITGEIEATGGEISFQDRKFKVLQGRLNFINPGSVEPYLDFRGETYVKDYRVTFTMNGLIDNLKPEFTSSPPLPAEDVLALLALGEAFRRTYSYDTTTRLSTASLLSFQIAEQAQKRAAGLFSLARFRIDPFVMGSSAEMTARLTVGRQLSRNLSILYSTNLTTQREEIVRMEWVINNDFSLVGMRNEYGRMSLDVKIRKRF